MPENEIKSKIEEIAKNYLEELTKNSDFSLQSMVDSILRIFLYCFQVVLALQAGQ